MPRIRTLIGLLVGLTLLSNRPMSAQYDQVREGFWIGFGLGYGSAGIGSDDCEECDFDREGGLSGHFKIGGALSDQLLLGFETNGWYKSEDGDAVTIGNASANIYFYPMVEGGLYVKGGAGLASIDDSFDSEYGVSLTVGAGYDIRIGDMTSITPFANYFRGSYDVGGIDLTTNVLQVGVGITFH